MEEKIPKCSKKQSQKSRVICDITSALKSRCCAILESISDGVFTINTEKRITSFNKAAESITGFTEKETIGQFCFDIFRTDICERNCALEKTLSCGKSGINLRAQIITKKGEKKPISISTAVLRNESGKVIGGVETFRDLSDLEELRRQANRSYTSEDIVGRHARMKDVLAFLPDIAESESTVLIEGPTGTGKELIARVLHRLSPRNKGPFIAVNCAALPDTLLESELFGYEKGAFTGAVRRKIGRFQMAHGGTLLLDEISMTSPKFQADLLRVLENGELTPLGSTRTLKIDTRIVAASNSDLSCLIKEGKFREDLFYRLNVIKIRLPALRDRKEDIPLLVDHFIRRFNLRKERNIRGISPAALDLLMNYPFPGNVRELENIIEFAFIACKESWIDIPHLPKNLLEERKEKPLHLSGRERLEADTIRAVLDRHAGDRHKTALVLRMSRTTLWRRIKKYQLSEYLDET